MILRRLREKILKSAQNNAPPEVPPDVFAYLNKGYNPETVTLIINLVNYLNTFLHYSSLGKDNFQKLSTNNLDLSGATGPHKNIGLISKKVFQTLLNNKNTFSDKVSANLINQWCNTIISMPEFNNLTSVNPTSQLATKLPSNLKTLILNLLNLIKSQNRIA